MNRVVVRQDVPIWLQEVLGDVVKGRRCQRHRASGAVAVIHVSTGQLDDDLREYTHKILSTISHSLLGAGLLQAWAGEPLTG